MSFALVYTLVIFTGYTVCGWIVLWLMMRIFNRLHPTGRRIEASGRSTLGGLLILFIGISAWHAVVRPPNWRSLLYEEMFDACREGNMARVQFWLWMGASPDGISDYEAGAGSDGFSSHVDMAVLEGNHRLLRTLLEKGANPNTADELSPLGDAIHNHDAESVKLLLAHGADPRCGYWQGDAVDHAERLRFYDLIPLIQPYLHAPQADTEK